MQLLLLLTKKSLELLASIQIKFEALLSNIKVY